MNNIEKGTLYVVATPIGNLHDISLRALETLKSVDVIAAEDTRVTQHLLQHFSIKGKLIALHEHNEAKLAEKLCAMLAQGSDIAVVSDAGTPAISDPGAYLVKAAHAAGIRVVPIPGANAAISALSAAGMITPRFLFFGFLPTKSVARKSTLTGLARLPYALVFYEAPHRVVETIADLNEVFGGTRDITIARELTKLFETIHKCPLSAAEAWIKHDLNQQKGEFVLVVEGNAEEATISDETKAALKIMLMHMPLRLAVQLSAELSGLKKNAMYEQALLLKKELDKR